MTLHSLSPLPFEALLVCPRRGAWAAILICKATLDLRPERCTLAPEQRPILWDDVPFDAPGGSLRHASDAVPPKAQADVVLVGSAFAPSGQATRYLRARLRLATIDKTVEVWGDRVLSAHGQLTDASPFTSLPMRYERAAAGTSNPVGVSGAERPPNLVAQGSRVEGPFEPTGFGPIAAAWPERAALLGPSGNPFRRDAPESCPLDGVAPEYFNVAPRDQRAEALEPDAALLLENLCSAHPTLRTRLPGTSPRAVVQMADGPLAEVALELDTVAIDTDAGLVTLTWRGRVPLEARDARYDAWLLTQEADRPLAWSEIVARIRGAPTRPAVPQRPSVRPGLERTLPAPVQLLPDPPSPLPFAPSARGSVPPPAPEAVSSPAALPGAAASPSARLPSVGAMQYPVPSAWRADLASASAAAAPSPAAHDGRAAHAGVLAVSNAAAAKGMSEMADPPTMELSGDELEAAVAVPRVPVKLIWFEESLPRRLRARGPFKGTVATGEVRRLEGSGLRRAPQLSEPEQARRDVLEVLTAGEPREVTALRAVLDAAASSAEAFEPPLVLIGCELMLPFDEIENLRATVAAVTPFAGTDRKLKEATSAASDLLSSPYLKTAGGLADSLRSQIRDAYKETKRAITFEALDEHVQRMLLEQRHFQTRALFGGTFVRCVLAGKVPGYLPESIKGSLPLYTRFEVRLLGEVDTREDQAETSGELVRVVAIARRVT